MTAPNLYVHFPFCRKKCTYCALHSHPERGLSEREGYVRRIEKGILEFPDVKFSTVYFGGGSPALCNLVPVFKALEKHIDEKTEFTVELHPLDVRDSVLDALSGGGVNRISMGVQSLDDKTLAAMGRLYTVDDARKAFDLIRKRFDNAGIDLIAGYPGDIKGEKLSAKLETLKEWGLKHCSVYSLILEEESKLAKSPARSNIPTDDETLDEISHIADFLQTIGLERYEISNYAVPGFECRHNMSVWRGEDYIGLGEGAHGRIGLLRTRDWSGEASKKTIEKVSPEYNSKERKIFSLRTREGLDASANPQWLPVLDRHMAEGLLAKNGTIYTLTRRGTEVCDSILADLV